MSLAQTGNGVWKDTPAPGAGGSALNDNFDLLDALVAGQALLAPLAAPHFTGPTIIDGLTIGAGNLALGGNLVTGLLSLEFDTDATILLPTATAIFSIYDSGSTPRFTVNNDDGVVALGYPLTVAGYVSATGDVVGANLRTSGNLGVGNSAAATTLGSVTKKVEIFNSAGTSLGFVPIYNSIT